METVATLIKRFSHAGNVTWIGVRPARKQPLVSLDEIFVHFTGLEGDHRKAPSKRTVTLIQAEHLPAIAALCRDQNPTIAPERLRRNIVAAGISLLGLRNQTFKIGNATLRGTGLCAPCSRMEQELGFGGYNAMRGHGGICAEVLEEGLIKVGDAVSGEGDNKETQD